MTEAIIYSTLRFSHPPTATHYQQVIQEGNGTPSHSDLMFPTQTAKRTARQS